MPGFVLTAIDFVTCTHKGKATPAVPASKITIMGAPAITLAVPYAVAGCQLPTITSGAPPCLTGKFTGPATKVTSMGAPLVTMASVSTCAPTAQPLTIGSTQTKVSVT